MRVWIVAIVIVSAFWVGVWVLDDPEEKCVAAIPAQHRVFIPATTTVHVGKSGDMITFIGSTTLPLILNGEEDCGKYGGKVVKEESWLDKLFGEEKEEVKPMHRN